MKVRILSRDPSDYIRETKEDIHFVPRNLSPAAHPFATQREYVRAITASKLQHLMAKPFLGCFGEQSEPVTVIQPFPRALSLCISGAANGKIAFWNIPKKKRVVELQAHDVSVRGLACHSVEDILYSCGDDKMVKTWKIATDDERQFTTPAHVITLKATPNSLDCRRNEDQVVVAADALYLYSTQRAEPIREWRWSHDSVLATRFNPVETNLIAACARDNSLQLFDVRRQEPLRKVVMRLRPNAVCWSPTEAYTLTTASEDFNLYTYDMRQLKRPRCVLRGHTNAVMDVDYAPTGQELVSAGYDGTIRLWSAGGSSPRDVYHTKRMQRVYTAKFTLDARFVLSASLDANLRLWKAHASEKLGACAPRERAAHHAAQKLREKFAEHPEVRKLQRQRRLPKSLKAAEREVREMRAAQRRRESNRRAHEGPTKVPFVAERERHVLTEYE